MTVYYILDETNTPIQIPNSDDWAEWFTRADRRMARTVVSADVTVLSVFSGTGEVERPDEIPLMFETRVFGGVLNGEMRACRTFAQTFVQHAELAEWCRIGQPPNYGLPL